MNNVAIRVQDLSRKYRIGAREEQSTTLRECLAHLAASPFDYLGRQLRGPSEEDIIWALKDVSFEVGRGEVVGDGTSHHHWAQRRGEDHVCFATTQQPAQDSLPHHGPDGGAGAHQRAIGRSAWGKGEGMEQRLKE